MNGESNVTYMKCTWLSTGLTKILFLITQLILPELETDLSI